MVWLHIPLTGLVLTGFGLGAAAFAVTLVEAKARERIPPSETQANKL